MQMAIGFWILWSGHKVWNLDLVRFLLSNPVGPTQTLPMDDPFGSPSMGPSTNIQVKVEGERECSGDLRIDYFSYASDDDIESMKCQHDVDHPLSSPTSLIDRIGGICIAHF